LGPFNQIIADTSKNFINKEFDQNAIALSTKVKIVPIKAYNLIGIVKCYYRLIHQAYSIIIIKIPGISKDIAL
jgi:hypothetical protein